MKYNNFAKKFNAWIPDLPHSYYQISGYSKKFTTTYLVTKEHMSMFAAKSIQIKGQSRDLSIECYVLRMF
jgi:hypothetical protein